MAHKNRAPEKKAPIYIYVTEDAKAEFATYAAEFGLDETALANLLIAREQRVGSLRGLDDAVLRLPGRTEKIVARIPAERHRAFESTAKDLGFKVSEAGALLVSLELQLRWLDRSIGLDSD